MPPDRLPREVLQACQARKRPATTRQTKVQVERLYLCTGLGTLWDPPVRADVAKEREVCGPLLKLLPLQPDHGYAVDDGWMDGYIKLGNVS